MRKNNCLAALLLGSSLYALASPVPFALAQESSSRATAGEALEEIIVTARRKEERIQDVPIAITAFSQEGLLERSIEQPNDLTDNVPGLMVVGQAGQRTSGDYVIRGQSTDAFSGDAGALPYFADVPMANFDPQFFDVENIQVLKGPQGTLFGKNTTGGAILTVPVKPTNEFGGYAQVQLGDYNDRQYEGAVNIPLVQDKVLLRVAGQYWTRNGFTRNLYTGDELDDVNRYAARVTLTVRPIESVESTTIYSDVRRDEPTSLVLSAVTPAFPAFLTYSPAGGAGAQCPCANPMYPLLAPWLAAQQARGVRTVDTDAQSKSFFDGWFIINTTAWDIDQNLILKNIFSDSTKDQYTVSDFDGSPLAVGQGFQPPDGQRNRTRDNTEELQLLGKNLDNRLSWIVGGFYEDTRYAALAPLYDLAEAVSPFPALPGSLAPLTPAMSPVFAGVLLNAWQDPKARSDAVYASVTYKFDSGLSLTGGGRRTRDERELIQGDTVNAPAYLIAYVPALGQYVQNPPSSALAVNPAAPKLLTSQSYHGSANTGDVTADYKLSGGQLIYATVRRGYKSGGVNEAAPAGQQLFSPEYLMDYELGAKGQWKAGGLRGAFDLAIFRDNYSDIQRNTTTTNFAVITTNVGSAVIQGVELEGTADLTDWLTVRGFFAYTDAYYNNWIYQSVYAAPAPGAPPATGTALFNFTNNPLPNVPINKWSLAPRVHFPLSDSLGEFSVAAQVSHVSQTAGSVTAPQSGPQAFIDAHTVTDLQIGLHHIAHRSLDLWATVTNLTNSTYSEGLLDVTNTPPGTIVKYYAPPRMWTVEARYEF